MTAHRNLPPTCLTARREQLTRRILSGELDDAPLYISTPPLTPQLRHHPEPRTQPATARTRCPDTRQGQS